MFDAEFFVALGFVLFVLGLGYLGVHSKLTAALDARVKRIGDELGEARSLRNEAAALLASFEKKKTEAEAEAAGIVAQARAEAAMMAKEAETRISDFIARRTRQAEAKIAQAETQASNDVRASAADAAVQAAETVLRGHVPGAVGASLVDRGIGELKALLN